MPTPLDLLLDPISQAVFGIYLVLLLWEAIAPARELPKVAGWRARGLIAFAMYFFLSSYLPLWWGEHLAAWQLIDLAALGTWGGAAIGVLVYEFGAYVYHRSLHWFQTLWRGVHQLHHSAERLDAYGAFWFSPLDMIGWTAVSSVALTLMVGLTPSAATVAMLFITLLGIFQHCNVKTPQWLGYLVQRPESHSHHHARGVHANNYADLPLFDVLFGTFHNPREFAREAGFYDGASSRVKDMLLWRDVSEPATPHRVSTADQVRI